nr:uncharacterized protein CI109_003849 [Kwoniella shandongensis]KAA5527877.1 hypothetical protein CI109_003849 [Kwoniella shandongensis]
MNVFFTYIVLLISSLQYALAAPTSLSKRYTSVKLKSFRTGQCLSPIGRVLADGVPVGTIDCSQARSWDISPGSGSVLISGTNYALDAGDGRTNNEKLKIWTSYPGLFQQTWYLTNDDRIAITGGNQCLDQGDDGPQTYQCTTGNTNQIWTVQTPTPEPPVFDPPFGTVYDDPPNGGRRLHPFARPDLCVTVDGANAVVGSRVDIAYCFANDSPYAQYQLFDLPNPVNARAVPLHSFTDLCLDVGASPDLGTRITLQSCAFPRSFHLWNFDGQTLNLEGRSGYSNSDFKWSESE